MARFLSPDTVVPGAGNPQALNRYTFVFNRPLVAVDPYGHDVVFVSGAGERVEANGGAEQWYEWIAEYKHWTKNESWEWGLKWNAADSAARKAMEEKDGIRFISYDSVREDSITDADIDGLHEQLNGLQDITLVGYSKGANLVENYMAAVQDGRYTTGPTAKNYVLLKAPGGFMEWFSGGKTPGQPFSDGENGRSISNFSSGSVSNVYSPTDPIGSQGKLSGAKNYTDDTIGSHSGGYASTTHGRPGQNTAAAIFQSLNTRQDHGGNDRWRSGH